MRGYVEMMERLAYNMPEGRQPTDTEIREALGSQSILDFPRETNQHRQLTLVPCATCELHVERRQIMATEYGMLCPDCWGRLYKWGFKDED